METKQCPFCNKLLSIHATVCSRCEQPFLEQDLNKTTMVPAMSSQYEEYIPIVQAETRSPRSDVGSLLSRSHLQLESLPLGQGQDDWLSSGSAVGLLPAPPHDPMATEPEMKTSSIALLEDRTATPPTIEVPPAILQNQTMKLPEVHIASFTQLLPEASQDISHEQVENIYSASDVIDEQDLSLDLDAHARDWKRPSQHKRHSNKRSLALTVICLLLLIAGSFMAYTSVSGRLGTGLSPKSTLHPSSTASSSASLQLTPSNLMLGLNDLGKNMPVSMSLPTNAHTPVAWTIDTLPSWLKVQPSSGILTKSNPSENININANVSSSEQSNPPSDFQPVVDITFLQDSLGGRSRTVLARLLVDTQVSDSLNGLPTPQASPDVPPVTPDLGGLGATIPSSSSGVPTPTIVVPAPTKQPVISVSSTDPTWQSDSLHFTGTKGSQDGQKQFTVTNNGQAPFDNCTIVTSDTTVAIVSLSPTTLPANPTRQLCDPILPGKTVTIYVTPRWVNSGNTNTNVTISGSGKSVTVKVGVTFCSGCS